MPFIKCKLVLILVICSLTSVLRAQVTGVNYQILFNPATCLFEGRLIINSGSATSPIQRAQFSAQYSIIVPTTSTLTLVSNHMPLQNNQNFGGIHPTVWFVSSYIQNPASLPDYDIYSITPSLTPTSFYNTLNTGDTIHLFSFSVDPLPPCASGVRPFENGVDPGSSAPGMNGGDFTNGFTIGGASQKYEGNAPTIYGSRPEITRFETSCSSDIAINLSANTSGCQAPLSFLWTGPMDFVSTSQSISIPNANHLNNGVYQVIISDNIGCKDTLSIQASAKPFVSEDLNSGCYLTGTFTLPDIGPGEWILGSNSDGEATISKIHSHFITVSAFSSEGKYYLVKDQNNCADTTIITVGNNCTCGITNIITQPETAVFCGHAENIQLTGNNSDSAGDFIWQYKFNNEPYTHAPGLNNQQNYQSTLLSVGTHSFRRIFSDHANMECKDTSNNIIIIVDTQPDAGQDHHLNCHENTSVTMNASGGTYWYPGGESNGTLRMNSVTSYYATVSDFSTHGTYYLIRSSMFCTDTSKIIIQNLCGCDAAIAGDSITLCAGDIHVLKGSCRVGRWYGDLSNPSGASITDTIDGQARLSLSKTALGNYRFIFTIGDTLTDTLFISVLSTPVINAGQDFEYCENSPPVTIVAGGAYSYIWSTGQTGSSIIVSPQADTDYIVTGTDIEGCSSTDTVSVRFLHKPKGTIPSMLPCYVNEDLQLLSGQWIPAAHYQWSGPMGFNANVQQPVITNVQIENAGMYYLTVTSADECTATASIQIEVYEKALPVNFLNFEGWWDKDKNLNQLYWSTASETNNDYYIIERGLTTDSFLPVDKVNGAGNSSSIQSYIFTDKDIVPGMKYFYRLRQVDYDERITYSRIIMIQTGTIRLQDYEVLLYPNPAIDNVVLRIETNPLNEVMVNIYDQNGINVHRNFISDVNENTNLLEKFHPDQMPSGVYSIQLSSAELQLVKRLRIVK